MEEFQNVTIDEDKFALNASELADVSNDTDYMGRIQNTTGYLENFTNKSSLPANQYNGNLTYLEIAIPFLVIFSHIFMICLIFFAIVKSNRSVERKLRTMMKYKPSKNWVVPDENDI